MSRWLYPVIVCLDCCSPALSVGQLVPDKADSGVDRTIEALGDDNPLLRAQSATHLAELRRGSGSAPPQLVDLLKDPCPTVRLAAIHALSAIADQSTAQRLAGAIADSEPHVQVAATLAVQRLVDKKTEELRTPVMHHALGEVFEVKTRYVPPNWYAGELRKATTREARGLFALAFGQESPDLDAGAAQLLQVIHANPNWTANLEALLTDRVAGERVAIAFGRCLTHADERVRRMAIRSMFFYGGAYATWDKVVDALADSDAIVRLYAARTIDVRFDDDLVDAPFPSDALGRLLLDDDELVRCAAVVALESHWLSGLDQLRSLLRALRSDASPLVRMRVALALARSIPLPDETSAGYQPVLESLRDKDPVVRGLTALATFAWSEEEVDLRRFRDAKDIVAIVPLVLKAIQRHRTVSPLPQLLSKPDNFDAVLIDCLGIIGPKAKNAVPFLLEDLAEFDDLGPGDSRCGRKNQRLQSTLVALARIGPGALADLNNSLESDHLPVRTMGAMSLALNHESIERTVPILIQSLDGPCWGRCTYSHVLRTDTCCLALLGKHAVPELLDLLRKDKHRSKVIEALSMMRDDANSVVPMLLPVQGNREEKDNVRAALSEALGSLGRDHPGVLPCLVQTLSNKEEPEAIRVAAIRGLHRMGVKAKPALPMLKEASREDSEAVREAANSAVRHIEARAIQRDRCNNDRQ